MKALSDNLKIAHGVRDERGDKLEPEEMPVDRVMDTVAKVTVGDAPGGGAPIDLPMRVSVTNETTALEAVSDFTRQCQFCRHWDQATYQRERLSYDPDVLDEQRASVLEVATTDEMALLAGRERADAILDATLGRCRAISDFVADETDTHARATCPAHFPDGRPFPSFFRASPEAARTLTSIRDRILNAAAGKDA